MTARDRILLMVVAVVALTGGFWMLVLSPRRHQAADLAQQVSAQRAQLAQVARQLAATPAGEQAQAAGEAELARLGKAVPADDQMASLMYQLQDAAGRAHVTFNSIQPSGANGAPAGNAAAAAPPATPAPSSGTSTTPAAPSTPAAPGATPATGGIQQLDLSLVFDGRYADLERFLRRVHGFTTVHGQTIRVSGRLLSIDGIQLAAAPAGFPEIRATITATAYVAPAVPQAAGAAGSAAPAAATASVAAPSSGSSAPPTTPAMVGGAG